MILDSLVACFPACLLIIHRTDFLCQYECCFTLERAHTADVNCVAWAPAVAASSADASSSPLLATASDDGTVKLWRFTPPEV